MSGDRHGPSDPPEEIGAVVRSLLGEGRMRRGVALGVLVRSWGAVVGGELAAHTAPRALEAGSLVVAAATPGWAARARFLSHDIRGRANRVLRGERVTSVKVVVSPDARKPLGDNGSGPPPEPGGSPGSRGLRW